MHTEKHAQRHIHTYIQEDTQPHIYIDTQMQTKTQTQTQTQLRGVAAAAGAERSALVEGHHGGLELDVVADILEHLERHDKGQAIMISLQQCVCSANAKHNNRTTKCSESSDSE